MGNNEGSKSSATMGTIASLSPAGQRDMSLPLYKTSHWPQGTTRNPLLRPSRLIEHSRYYMPGDPIQAIDWRAFARTEQLLIRQIRDDSMAKVAIALDLSSTMRWPPKYIDNADIPSKAEIAIRIGLYLAFAHKSLGNQIEFWVLENEQEEQPSLSLSFTSLSEIRQVFEELSRSHFDIQIILNHSHRQNFMHQMTRDINYWISDCLGQGDFMSFFGQCRRGQMFHTLSTLETNITWVGLNNSYYDERYEQKEFQGKTLLDQEFYKRNLNEWMKSLHQKIHNAGMVYHFVTDQTTIESFLSMTNDFSTWKQPAILGT